jgi:hypothetical protein
MHIESASWCTSPEHDLKLGISETDGQRLCTSPAEFCSYKLLYLLWKLLDQGLASLLLLLLLLLKAKEQDQGAQSTINGSQAFECHYYQLSLQYL